MSSAGHSIIVRDVRDDDVEAITDIYAENVINTTTTYELDPPSPSTMRDRLFSTKAAGFPCLVAEQMTGHRTVLGYAYVNAFRSRPAYRFTVEHSVYVASDTRGRGVGTLLMERIVIECEKLGFHQIVAVIGDGNPDSPSCLFHQKLGFRYSGKLEGSGFKFGRWLDTTFMQLAINGGIHSLPGPTSMREVRLQT